MKMLGAIFGDWYIIYFYFRVRIVILSFRADCQLVPICCILIIRRLSCFKSIINLWWIILYNSYCVFVVFSGYWQNIIWYLLIHTPLKRILLFVGFLAFEKNMETHPSLHQRELKPCYSMNFPNRFTLSLLCN